MNRARHSLPLAPPGCRFEDEALLVGLVPDGDLLFSQGGDPQVVLTPLEPVPAGWCRFLLRGEGDFRDPRLYLDLGEGLSESHAIDLAWREEARGFAAVSCLPSPALRVRIDPSDGPGRFRVQAFHVEPFALAQAAEAMRGGALAPPSLSARAFGRVRSALQTLTAGSLPQGVDEGDGNVRLVACERSHLSGLSLRLDSTYLERLDLVCELHEIVSGGTRILRTVRVAAAQFGAQEWEYLYWPPIEASAGRVLLVRVRAARNTRVFGLSRANVLLDAKLIHSNPDPHLGLPRAVMFSPVTQCNLNCTHCISRPTRSSLNRAPERAWDAVGEISRGPHFRHLAMDYSGDMLFNELKHGGLLSRIVALDVPYRMDTNANCLEEGIVDTLVGSRLFEINFSLDSMDPDVYRRIRHGSIPLDEVLAKIVRFMRRRNEAAPAIRTILSFVLMRSNAGTILPAFAFAKEHGIDFVSVCPLIAFTPDMVDEVFVTDDAGYRELYARCVDESVRTGVGLNMQAPVAKWRDGDGHAPCDLPWGTTSILGNGDVMACCVPGSLVGNIHEEPFEAIWNGARYRAFRARVNTLDPPEPCRNCPMARLPGNRKAYVQVPADAGHPIAVARRSRPAIR